MALSATWHSMPSNYQGRDGWRRLDKDLRVSYVPTLASCFKLRAHAGVGTTNLVAELYAERCQAYRKAGHQQAHLPRSV